MSGLIRVNLRYGLVGRTRAKGHGYPERGRNGPGRETESADGSQTIYSHFGSRDMRTLPRGVTQPAPGRCRARRSRRRV